jgi:hypothetical protein
VSTRSSGCARSVAGELSWVSNVASFSGKWDCELEVTCRGVKDVSGTDPSVNNLEPGVVRSICDVGEADSEDIRSTESVSLEASTGEDDDGMPGTIEGGSTSKSVLYSRSTAPLDGSDGEIAVKATTAGRESDSELSIGEMTGVSA